MTLIRPHPALPKIAPRLHTIAIGLPNAQSTFLPIFNPCPPPTELCNSIQLTTCSSAVLCNTVDKSKRQEFLVQVITTGTVGDSWVAAAASATFSNTSTTSTLLLPHLQHCLLQQLCPLLLLGGNHCFWVAPPSRSCEHRNCGFRSLQCNYFRYYPQDWQSHDRF